jgi:predicted ATP-dependent endonuclease of OLD family
MKLVRFSVNNFRCINGGLDKNCVNFEGSNAIFIFGQNNVGKSSFLKAYEAFYDDSISNDDFSYSNERDIEMEVWFKLDESEDKEEIDQGTGNKFDNLKGKYLSEGLLKLKKTWKFEDKGKKPVSETYNVVDSVWDAKSYGGIGTHPVFKPLMMKPLFIKAMPTEKQVEDIVNEILKEAATKKLSDSESDELKAAEQTISKLQDKAYSKTAIDEYRKKVNERFNSLFSDYEVDIDDGTSKVKYTHDKLGKDFKITFNKKDTEQASSYLQMGHGAVRMAIFLLMLMRDELREEGVAQKDYLVLFEEPELFLHPTLTKRLRDLIYQVSGDDMPFQILSASHSPQMIDISKEHTSLVRMVKQEDALTSLFQVKKEDLKNSEQKTDEEVKNKIFEILRFDPFICEAFYADEVVLVEGDTEAIIWRGYQQSFDSEKDVFVVNCHSCTNIPFYQKVFSKFNIPYSVICDTDKETGWNNEMISPTFTSGIQKSIADQFYEDKQNDISKHFLVFEDTFEPAHSELADELKYDNSGSEGKPFKANRYWEKILAKKDLPEFATIPIVNYMKTISDS